MNWISATLIAGASATAVLASPPAYAQASCAAGAERKVVVEMLFGRNVGDKAGVSDDAWRRFLDREVTPRFPAGFTVYDARGQWRDTRSGRIVREASKVVMIVTSDDPAARTRLKHVAEAYKTRFRQQSVALVERPACVSF